MIDNASVTCHIQWIRSNHRKETIEFPWESGFSGRGLIARPYVQRFGDTFQFQLDLVAEETVTLQHIELTYTISGNEKPIYRSGFANGYQSWTLSREIDNKETFKPVRSLLSFMKPLGDAQRLRYDTRPGSFHSWSFTYLRFDDHLFFIGSLGERSGLTLFRWNPIQSILFIQKECKGRRLLPGEAYVGLSLWGTRGIERWKIAEAYGTALNLPRYPSEKFFGWTSWYYFYNHISEEVLLKEADSLAASDLPLDYLQIDDGYQPAVGDWLLPHPRFPHGMGYVAEAIRSRGFSPGLWIAPFIAEKRSALFTRHPQWFLRHPNGRLVSAGWNNNWSGTFYALDLAREDVQTYLTEVFQRFRDDWGFQLIKADFLYAAALQETPEQTRGERLYAALDFLRSQTSGQTLLGCGVPLLPAAGLVDICRIGADVAPYWEDAKLKWARYPERVSTYSSLTNTLNRSWLNEVFFKNDPDVFILRQTASKLLDNESITLFVTNLLLSGAIFFSDRIDEYSAELRHLLQRALPLVTPDYIRVDPQSHAYTVDCRIGDHQYLVLINLGDATSPIRWKPESGSAWTLFDQLKCEYEQIVRTETAWSVPPHDCRLYRLSPWESSIVLLGTSMHLLGGAGDIAELAIDDTKIRYTLKDRKQEQGAVWFGVPPELGLKSVLINEEETPVQYLNGIGVAIHQLK